MTDSEEWENAVKDVKRLRVNRYVEEIKPKDIPIRKNKIQTVTYSQLSKGKSIAKDDFSQMDGALTKRFKREEFKIEATLDLHGSTEKDASDLVSEFIKSAYNAHKRCVLIITGKGWDDRPFSGKGILRKSVPQWLSNSEISSLILAYKNPSEALGGSGALYILLRKNHDQ